MIKNELVEALREKLIQDYSKLVPPTETIFMDRQVSAIVFSSPEELYRNTREVRQVFG